MFNPSAFMRISQAKDTFFATHPKVVAFGRALFSRPLEAGTVIEVTVTRPGEPPISANMKVQPSDLELLQLLRELGEKQN